MASTTIKISHPTKERLDKFKEYKKESYEEVLQKILFIINLFKANPLKARKILRSIEISKIKGKSEKIMQERLLKRFEHDEDEQKNISSNANISNSSNNPISSHQSREFFSGKPRLVKQ